MYHCSYAFLLYDVRSLEKDPACNSDQTVLRLGPQTVTSTLTFGRDRLGRRSLLINSGGDGDFVISSVSPERSQSPLESPTIYKAYQEVDCSSFWQIKVRELGFDASGEVGLEHHSGDRHRADTMQTHRSTCLMHQLL